MTPPPFRIARAAPDFDDWPGVLALVRAAFAYMEGRIDPPSSLGRMDAASMREKAGSETLLLAHDAGGALVGCLFAAPRPDALYIGKMAVRPDLQGAGLGRALMAAAEDLARARGLPFLELQTRVELSGNHEAFARMGFRRTGETAHEGYDRPTSLTFRKAL